MPTGCRRRAPRRITAAIISALFCYLLLAARLHCASYQLSRAAISRMHGRRSGELST